MEMNWIILILILLVAIPLIILFYKQNRKDRKNLFKKLPDFYWIAAKGLDGGVFHRVIAVPEAIRASEAGDAGLHRDASSGKGHHPGMPPDDLG